MHTTAYIHKLLQDTANRTDGYDIKTIIFSGLPWPTFQECRVVLADGTIFAALFEDGEKITPFIEMPRENK